MDKEARIIGMESNIENFVASDLLKLRKRAPVMVTPAPVSYTHLTLPTIYSE